MTRNDFLAFCAAHNLSTVSAGRDWRDALVNGTYICVVIDGDEKLATVKPLIESGDAYLACAERKSGNDWHEHSGYGHFYADDANCIKREMAGQYAQFLQDKDDISYYGAADIAHRDKAFTDNPARKGESEQDHFERVEEMQDDGCLAPLYVTEPGYWHCDGGLMLSEEEKSSGFWSYGYDNWKQCVILVLSNTEEDA